MVSAKDFSGTNDLQMSKTQSMQTKASFSVEDDDAIMTDRGLSDGGSFTKAHPSSASMKSGTRNSDESSNTGSERYSDEDHSATSRRGVEEFESVRLSDNMNHLNWGMFNDDCKSHMYAPSELDNSDLISLGSKVSQSAAISSSSILKIFNTEMVFEEPKAVFSSPSEVCPDSDEILQIDDILNEALQMKNECKGKDSKSFECVQTVKKTLSESAPVCDQSS